MLTVHKDGFCDVVRVVASYYVIDVEYRCTPVESLSSEDAAECAVVLLPDLRHYSVHGPAVKLVVREDLERHVILLLIPFDRLRCWRSSEYGIDIYKLVAAYL